MFNIIGPAGPLMCPDQIFRDRSICKRDMVEIEVSTYKAEKGLAQRWIFSPISDIFGHLAFLVLYIYIYTRII